MMEDIDETFKLLENLTEEELLALDEEFDPNDDYRPSSEKKREDEKARKFEKRDMVSCLEQIIKKNQAGVPRNSGGKPSNTPSLKSRNSSGKPSNTPSLKSNTSVSPLRSPLQKQYVFSEEEDEVFNQLTEEDLIELAGLTNTHGLLTQEENARFAGFHNGEELPDSFHFCLHRHGMPYQEPVKCPAKRLMSMSEDNADLDTILLMDSLRNDSENLFYVRVNNIKLEKPILHAIFGALKTTKVIKHLSLAGINMKDEDGLLFNEAFKENTSIETLNLESNELTNLCIEPLCEMFETHPTIREFKCSHQTHGLGSRGEEAMARALNKNERLLKISYPFKVQSARSLADRCQIRNNEILRQRRSKGEDFYNYRQEIEKRDAHAQPWIRARDVNKNEKMKSDLADQKGRMKSVPSVGRMRAEAKLRAKENAKPVMDSELAMKLNAARKSRGRSISLKD